MKTKETHSGGALVRAITVGSVAAIAGLLFGFDTGVISGAQEFIYKTFNIAGDTSKIAMLKGFIVAAVPLGALFGAMFSGSFAHGLGRRMSLIYTAVFFLIGSMAAAFAFNIEMIVLGRLTMGFAIGISAMIAPMYLSEVSPPKIRGSVIFLFQLAITIGLLGAFCTNYIFAKSIADYTVNWRWMFGIGIIPSALLFFGMLNMPYSPRWLVLKGRKTEATSILKRLLDKSDVSKEIEEIDASVSRQGGSIKALFDKALLPLIGITFGLFVFQQLSGINAIMYYGPEVFRAAGFGNSSEMLAQIAMGSTNVVMSVVGLWIIDRIGRRSILFLGMGGIIICLTILGFLLQAGITSSMNSYAALGLVLAFVSFFAIGLGATPYIIMSEVFPLKARATGMAVASCANWGFNMMVSFSFGLFKGWFGLSNVFFMYAGFTAVGFTIAYIFLPETKGRRLECIEKNLYSGKPLRKLGEASDTEGTTLPNSEVLESLKEEKPVIA